MPGDDLLTMSDSELMAAYVAGDKRAFATLFARHAPVLLRVMGKDLLRPEDANDLVQQTFLQLHRHRADFRAGAEFRPWLYTIALNLKRQYFRRGAVRVRARAAGEPSSPPGAEGTEAQRQVEARLEIEYALGALSDGERDVIVMHWIGGLPLSEVAAILGLGLSAAKVRAHRAYARMRKRLDAKAEAADD